MAPTEGHAYLTACGVILLHMFKTSVVICSVSKQSLRLLVGVLIASSVLLQTPELYRDVGRSLNVHVAGFAATAAMCIVVHCLRYPDGRCPTLQELGKDVFDYIYQHTSSNPAPAANQPTNPAGHQQQPELTRGAAVRNVLIRCLQSCLLYPLYDLVMTVVESYPHAELARRSLLFRAAHSYAFGIALYLTFQIALVPFLALTWVLHPAGQSNAVRVFDRPWRATSLAELWGRRWHQMFRSSFVHLAYRPTRTALAGLSARLKAARPAAKAPAALATAERALPLLATFVLSGAVHEYMCWAGLGRATGQQLQFFLLHAALVSAEQALCAAAPQAVAAVPRWAKQAALHLVFLLTAPLFTEPWLQADYHTTFWHPWSAARPLLRAAGVLPSA